MDCRGYGVTLAAVNVLGVLCCVFQVGTSSGRARPRVLEGCMRPAHAGAVQRRSAATDIRLLQTLCSHRLSPACRCRHEHWRPTNPKPKPSNPVLVQAIPSLPVQALTLASWCASRVILYSSFYAIVGALFGLAAISLITVTCDEMSYSMQYLESAYHHLHGHNSTQSALCLLVHIHLAWHSLRLTVTLALLHLGQCQPR